MRSPAAPLSLGLAVALGCRGTTESDLAEPALATINGATQAAVLPGDTISLAGRGFGSVQGDGQVLLTTGGGLQPAEIFAWTDNLVRARLPDGTVSGPAFIERGGVRLGPVSVFVRSREPFAPAARPWSEGPQAPRPLWAAGAVALRFPSNDALSSLVVLTAGVDPAGEVTDSTYLGTVDASGIVANWVAAADTVVPAARYHHTMAGADRTNTALGIDGVAYMIGGIGADGRILADVLGIGVTAEAEFGFWTPLTPLPQGRVGASATIAFGNLIVLGGMGPDSVASAEVHVASINEDGTLNGWFDGPPLPEGRAFAALVVHGARIFVVGGQTGDVRADSVDPTSLDLRASVYTARLSRQSGFFADEVWTESAAQLAAPRARHAAFALDSALVVTGGVLGGPTQGSETEFAVIRADGSLGTFASTGQIPISDLDGGPLRGAAAPVIWDARGVARATLVGGRGPNGEISHSVWWH